jgi:hypothetical protein
MEAQILAVIGIVLGMVGLACGIASRVLQARLERRWAERDGY